MDNTLIFIEIVLINVLLSGDNALVIAMASQQLPQKQRKLAIWWGAIVAVVLRCLLTVVALQLLQISYLQAIGALLLFYIAVKLLVETGGNPIQHNVTKTATLTYAIWTIFTADLIMSLDNVLAIAAVANGDVVLILLGIAMSIPMIIWGSQLLGNILRKIPALSYIGSALLAYAAGEMLMNDPGMDELIFHGSKQWAELVPLLCVPLVIMISILKKRAN